MIPDQTRAILFDVYGTLLDGPRHPDQDARMAEVLKRFGLPEHPSLNAALGRLITSAHEDSPEPWPEIDIREVWQSLFPGLTAADDFALEMEEAVHPVAPTPWAVELLDAAVTSGARLGVVSNAQAYTRALLALHFPDHWPKFREDLCALSYEHRIAKPDLRLFMHALDPLLAAGINASEILIVGDSEENDHAPARQLGLRFLKVPPVPGSEGAA